MWVGNIGGPASDLSHPGTGANGGGDDASGQTAPAPLSSAPAGIGKGGMLVRVAIRSFAFSFVGATAGATSGRLATFVAVVLVAAAALCACGDNTAPGEECAPPQGDLPTSGPYVDPNDELRDT